MSDTQFCTILKVDASRAGQGDIQCEAKGPKGRVHNMAAVYRNGRYVMNFTPSDVGKFYVYSLLFHIRFRYFLR